MSFFHVHTGRWVTIVPGGPDLRRRPCGDGRSTVVHNPLMDVTTRVFIALGVAVAAVGALDAALGDDWDLFAIFVLVVSLQVAVWARQRDSRRNVTLRPDLAHWLDDRAHATGEPFDDVLDRAVATYQHGLHVDR